MKNKYFWVIIALCTINLILLYNAWSKDQLIYKINNEISILKENENEYINAYFKGLQFDALIRSDLFYMEMDSILVKNNVNYGDEPILLILIPMNTCWSCVEDELKNIINMGYNVLFVCPDYIKNGIKLLDKGKCKMTSIPSLISNQESFNSITYVRYEKGKVSNVYKPIYGTHLKYIEEFMR